MVGAPSLAYCSICRGVLPFETCGRHSSRERCSRCGTEFRRCHPGAPDRRRAARYLLYGSVAGLLTVVVAVGGGKLAPWLSGDVPWAGTVCLLLALGAGCLARSALALSSASRYEPLAPHEWDEVSRRLCAGMIRSEVEDELWRRGWRPGKVRTILDGLSPIPKSRFRPAAGTAPAPAPPDARRTW
ncbi:MAG: hypothetical protein ACREAA_20070 [Candidatus Polarisedimenticolia bacterium]